MEHYLLHCTVIQKPVNWSLICIVACGGQESKNVVSSAFYALKLNESIAC